MWPPGAASRGRIARPVPRLPRLPALAALPLACAAVAVSSCGAADDAKQTLDPVAEAAAATQQAGNARIAIRGTLGVAGERVTIDGGGVVSGKGSRARLTMRLNLGGRSVRMDQIVDGTVIYLGGELMAAAMPGGARWFKVDIGELAAGQGIDLSRFDGGTGDVTRQLQWLEGAGDVRKLGREQVNGVPTTHYSARIELAKLAKDGGDPATKRSLERLVRLSGARTIPVDVWVDDDKRVRRQRTAFGPVPQGAGGSGEITVDFVAFGVPLDVDPPPGGEIFDATELVAQGARSGG